MLLANSADCPVLFLLSVVGVELRDIEPEVADAVSCMPGGVVGDPSLDNGGDGERVGVCDLGGDCVLGGEGVRGGGCG